MLKCIMNEENEENKTTNYLEILKLVDKRVSPVSWIDGDVVTEAVAGVHAFVFVDFDGLAL
jgi:hypothetical protein